MVLTDQCELLAFGAKIGRRDGWARVEQVVDTEPIEGVADRFIHPAQLGGTRHLSAAQFGHDQRDSIALVWFTGWPLYSICMVYAQRGGHCISCRGAPAVTLLLSPSVACAFRNTTKQYLCPAAPANTGRIAARSRSGSSRPRKPHALLGHMIGNPLDERRAGPRCRDHSNRQSGFQPDAQRVAR